MPALPDITTEADVRVLVDSFYGAIQQDDLLNPIFSDVAQVDWAHHLPKMYAFWNNLILGIPRNAANEVIFHRHNHLKRGYTYIEGAEVVTIFHLVAAFHFSHFGAQITPAYILIGFARFNNGLNAHYALAFYFAMAAVAVEDFPMPAQQLYRKRIVIFKRDTVGEHVLRLDRIAVVRLIKRFNTHLNPLRYDAIHNPPVSVKLTKMPDDVKSSDFSCPIV